MLCADWPVARLLTFTYKILYLDHIDEDQIFEITSSIIMFMMDPSGSNGTASLLNHKCCHFASPCRAVYCQGLKVFQF